MKRFTGRSSRHTGEGSLEVDGGCRYDTHGLGHWHVGGVCRGVGGQSSTVCKFYPGHASNCRYEGTVTSSTTTEAPRLAQATAVSVGGRSHSNALDCVEANQIQEAMEAMRKEYARLAACCWNERCRRSKDDVIREAREEGRDAVVSMVYGTFGEKASELLAGAPRQKHKGRAVLCAFLS